MFDGADRIFVGSAAELHAREKTYTLCVRVSTSCVAARSRHTCSWTSPMSCKSMYSLGATFLKFRESAEPRITTGRSLSLHPTICRQAGTRRRRVPAVGATALKVVQRMKRDWIETGRRPAGVCAAALLVSARAHGFHRTQQDVVSALRVCGMTVSKRLADFQ